MAEPRDKLIRARSSADADCRVDYFLIRAMWARAGRRLIIRYAIFITFIPRSRVTMPDIAPIEDCREYH